MSENIKPPSFPGFDHFVTELKSNTKRRYDRCVNRDLSQQNWQGLFKRNVISALQQAYDDALTHLKQLVNGAESEEGLSGLTSHVLRSFDGFVDELFQYALQKHRTSCALSNFPDEHKPSQDYIADVLRETAQDWSDFVSQAKIVMTFEKPAL